MTAENPFVIVGAFLFTLFVVAPTVWIYLDGTKNGLETASTWATAMFVGGCFSVSMALRGYYEALLVTLLVGALYAACTGDSRDESSRSRT